MSAARVIALCTLLAWAGLSLLLAEIPWFRSTPLSDRLRPYTPGRPGRRPTRILSASSFHDVVSPIAASFGGALARGLGVTEEVTTRLERIHASGDAASFRLRQFGWASAGFAFGAAASVVLSVAPLMGALFVAGGAVLGALLVEQQLASASNRWQEGLFLELAVAADQLAILLASGASLGTAIQRLADRGQGCVARDLARVSLRMRQGHSEHDALQEWARLARVPSLDRLVGVLCLGHGATDLGRIVAAEAQSIRRESHRRLIETIEQRNQMVWIPVTVAALLPGVIFLAIPFIDAMKSISN